MSAVAAHLPAVRHRPLAGIGLILVMGLWFVTLDTTAKYLGQVLPIIVGLFARYAVQALLMGGWLALRLLRGGSNLFRTAHPRFQLLRGTLLLATSALLFLGIRNMPVAEFTAVGMLSPVLVTVLAAIFLHEKVSPLRLALVAGGFAGALIVVRPGAGIFGWVALIPLTMALVYAGFQLLTRRLSNLEHPLTTHFYTGLVGALVVGAILAFQPASAWDAVRNAPPSIWALLMLVGVAGTVGHLCLILAVGMAPMATLMPFTFLQLGFASVAGYLVFNHVPDGWAFVGIAVVGVCGATSVWLNLRESAAAQRIAPADSALTPD
ncbi:DMT family transporter [Piscinibacter gummiphilus]|uniref:DMT family transporter n=1 Tax=Piscinibacter gummiphilus TaxID=946333 RepID=A0ABZ0CYA7_9BURK|nr:DMT family transporter [Piscinibacter gummiphilus]WOB09931.1 DMT family transporter [Piscinibacter gummiphilus]